MTAWPSKSLGDAAEFYAGASLPPGEVYESQPGGFFLVKVSDMNHLGNEKFMKSCREWSQTSGARSATCPAGSVLIPKRGGAIGTNKKRITTRASVLDPNLMAIWPQPDVLDLGYLYHWLQNFDLTDIASGSSVPQLNKRDLEPLPIPIPPLDEQRRIVEVLDRADALRTRRREALTCLDELARSIFLDMFGDPDKSWPWRTVTDLAAKGRGAIRTGPFGSQLLRDEFVDEGIAVLGIDNVVKNEFTWDKRRYITPEKYRKLQRYTVYPGDVLISIMGTCGRCAIVPADISVAINTKHLCCITLDPEKCLPGFLHAYFLQHSGAQSYLAWAAKGAIMAGLNMEIIKDLPVALPPLTDQRLFAEKLGRITSTKVVQERQLGELNELFETLQYRAFRGEL
jgi:type I restriction enzyme S subunit